jgi:hypothetical protein
LKIHSVDWEGSEEQVKVKRPCLIGGTGSSARTQGKPERVGRRSNFFSTVSNQRDTGHAGAAGEDPFS